MPVVSIKTVFRDHWKLSKSTLYKFFYQEQWRSIKETVEKMLCCGDPSGGYAEYICTKCGLKKRVPFSCKSRFCTSCGKRYTDEWVEKTVHNILDISHRHLVFTISEELRIIIFNDRSLIKVMMDCASRAALEVLQSRGSMAIPGIIAIVHTFGRDLKFNPHVHLLMTEGGLLNQCSWQDIPFLPYNLLRKKWQYYLLTEIKARLPKNRDNDRLIDRLFKVNFRGFYVNGASKMTSSRYAARYIGRYIARPALAEYRIIRYDGQRVSFWYESHQSHKRIYLTLNAIEFIKRLIDHIAPKGFKMVRHYGLYARRTKSIAREILEGCRSFVQKSFSFLMGVPKTLNWRQRLINNFGKDPLECSKCHREMELWRIWHPRYGTIFDLSRDSPTMESYEKDQKKTQEKVKEMHQLCLFSV